MWRFSVEVTWTGLEKKASEGQVRQRQVGHVWGGKTDVLDKGCWRQEGKGRPQRRFLEVVKEDTQRLVWQTWDGGRWSAVPGVTGLNFFIVIFQYLSMTQHLWRRSSDFIIRHNEISWMCCSVCASLLSPLDPSASVSSHCSASSLSLFAFTRLSFSFVFLYPSRLHVSLLHLSSLPHPPLFWYASPHPLSFSLLYICRLYISTAPLYRSLSHTQHLYVSLSVSLSTSGFGRRKTAD